MRIMSIGTGAQGTRETLRIMAGLARDACNDQLFADYASAFKTTAEVHREHYPLYKYQHEEVETLYAPEYNLQILFDTGSLTGDCDDISMFYAALFYAMGLPTRFVAMKTKKFDPEYLHVVTEAFEDNRWKRFDPTVTPGMVQIDYGRMIENV